MSKPLQLIVPSVLLLSWPLAHAVDLPIHSVRNLVLQADTIVLAEPLDPSGLQHFKVVELLKGAGLKKEDAFTLVSSTDQNPQLPVLDLQPAGKILGRVPLERYRVSQALLFLGPNCGTAEKPQFASLPSGMRFLTTDKKHLMARPQKNPGTCELTVEPDGDWMAWLSATRADLAAVERVQFLRNIHDPRRRNQRLLEWVEQHRHEFGSVHPERNGWGDLETDVFDWVLASGIPEDCWAAVCLYAQLNHGASPPLKGPAFGTREGRDYLLRIVLDANGLTSSRVRALHLLGDQVTGWRGANAQPAMTPVSEVEVADLLDKLLPFLTDTNESFRTVAVRCLQRLSQETSREADKKRTLEALIQAYQAEKPGPVRDDLAEAVCLLGGPERWQQLTGNPAGIRVHVRDLTRDGNKVSFWLGMPASQMTVTDCPTLVLERLNREGLPAEKKSMLLPTAVQPTPWNEGWDGRSYLPVQFPIEGLTAGTWRVGVEGTGKKDKDVLKWTAEPKTFVVEMAKNAKPGSDNLLDKIKGLIDLKK